MISGKIEGAEVHGLFESSMKLVQLYCDRLVNMAFLAVIGSKSTNGVAAIHSEIIKETIFKARPYLLDPT